MRRYATLADMPRLVELATREHAMSPWAHHEFDPMVVRGTATSFITGWGRTVLFNGTGYLAGLIQPDGFSQRSLALEFAWFSEGAGGMELLDWFESWAADMGASAVVVHDHAGIGRLPKILNRRRGYSHLGTTMTKPTTARPAIRPQPSPTAA